jgi:hypothetical protein
MRAEVLQEFDLTQFPFDAQTLLLSIRVPRHLEQNVEKVVLIRPNISFPTNFLNHSSCTIDDASSSCSVEEQSAIGEANRKPTIVAKMIASRESFYWVANVGVPLLIMNSISFAVFLLEPDMLAERLALIVTVLLTVVTFKSALESRLPVLNYLTLLDRWIVFLYCSLCAMALEAAVVHVIVKEGTDTSCAATCAGAGAGAECATSVDLASKPSALQLAKLIDTRTCLVLVALFAWVSSVMCNFPAVLAGKRTRPVLTSADMDTETF